MYGITISVPIRIMVRRHHLKQDIPSEFFERNVTKKLDQYTLRFFTTTTGLRLTAVFMAAKDNTARLRSICQSPTSSIWNGDCFRKWAEQIDSSTCQVVDALLTSKRVEQQSYRSCMGLLKLADKYSVD